MYLLMSVDAQKAYLALEDQHQIMASQSWLLEKKLAQTLLKNISDFLQTHQIDFSDLKGLGVFAGPAGFTDLRVIHVVANTLAYSLKIPVVNAGGASWQKKVVAKLQQGLNDKIIQPNYGKPASITRRLK